MTVHNPRGNLPVGLQLQRQRIRRMVRRRPTRSRWLRSSSRRRKRGSLKTANPLELKLSKKRIPVLSVQEDSPKTPSRRSKRSTMAALASRRNSLLLSRRLLRVSSLYSHQFYAQDHRRSAPCRDKEWQHQHVATGVFMDDISPSPRRWRLALC